VRRLNDVERRRLDSAKGVDHEANHDETVGRPVAKGCAIRSVAQTATASAAACSAMLSNMGRTPRLVRGADSIKCRPIKSRSPLVACAPRGRRLASG
jgi:hypothetical protein